MLAIILTAMAAEAAQAPASGSAPDDPIICTKEHIGSEVGTHLQSKKICMRKSDRDFIERSQQETMRAITNRGDDRTRYIPPPPH